MTSAIQLNKFVKKQRIPIRVIENSTLSSTTSILEKNEKVTEYFDEVNNVAPIEVVTAIIESSVESNTIAPAPIHVVNALIESSNEVNDIAPIEMVNTSLEVFDEVSEVAPIEVVNAPIEISNKVNDIAPIDVVNTPLEVFDEVSEVAPNGVVNAPIEISNKVNDIVPIASSNEMKRQQHKNKETSWLFNIFSKKH